MSARRERADDSALGGRFEIDLGRARAGAREHLQLRQLCKQRFRDTRALTREQDDVEIGEQIGRDVLFAGTEMPLEERDLGPLFLRRPVDQIARRILPIIDDGNLRVRHGALLFSGVQC